MEWYYVTEGRRRGPVSLATLSELLREGELPPASLVWNHTFGEVWRKASAVPELAAALQGRGGGHPPYGAHAGLPLNKVLTAEARQRLQGRWGLAALGALIIFTLSLAVGQIPEVQPLASLLFTGPLALGYAIFILTLASSNENPSLLRLFDGFGRLLTSMGAYLLMLLFVVLWSLLLIVPGIIAALSYAMTYFILADDPACGPLEAIRRSKLLMRGAKGQLFMLHLRFIGWWLLCLFTCGLAYFWVQPYFETSKACLYRALRHLPAGSLNSPAP